MKILCKVTSRGRPQELIKCIDTYLSLCDNSNNTKWLFSFDEDDSTVNNPAFLNSLYSRIEKPIIILGSSTSKINAINRDVNIYGGEWDILVNISDDQLAEKKGWDTVIINSMPTSLDYSLWFYDGWQNRINTMEILGRNYYNRFKYIYHPEYKSFYCDNEATEIAVKLNKVVKSDECIIKHYHYGWMPDTHMKKDETYKKAELTWNQDEQLFKKRKSLNYGL